MADEQVLQLPPVHILLLEELRDVLPIERAHSGDVWLKLPCTWGMTDTLAVGIRLKAGVAAWLGTLHPA